MITFYHDMIDEVNVFLLVVETNIKNNVKVLWFGVLQSILSCDFVSLKYVLNG